MCLLAKSEWKKCYEWTKTKKTKQLAKQKTEIKLNYAKKMMYMAVEHEWACKPYNDRRIATNNNGRDVNLE